jgi:hypothetical protein
MLARGATPERMIEAALRLPSGHDPESSYRPGCGVGAIAPKRKAERAGRSFGRASPFAKKISRRLARDARRRAREHG